MINSFGLGDCLTLLPRLPAKSVDHVVTDPPYQATQNRWDKGFDIERWWEEIKRVTRFGVIMTARNPFAARMICANLKGFRYDYVWAKNRPTGFLNAKRMPLTSHELILVFGKPKYFPQMTGGHKPGNAYTKHNGDGSNYGDTERGFAGGGKTERYPRSVVNFRVVDNDGSGEARLHPTQKPVALFEHLLLTHTEPGELILDPFCGSGTLADAAARHNRNFLCWDIDPAMLALAQQRFQSTHPSSRPLA